MIYHIYRYCEFKNTEYLYCTVSPLQKNVRGLACCNFAKT